MGALDDMVAQLTGLPQDRLASVVDATKQLSEPWIPSPGPQTDAYFSKADVLLFGGEPGGGKLLNVNTPLPTPHGWTTMGEVQEGDDLLDESGLPCRVILKSEVQMEKSFRLKFSDGSQIEAGANHQWVTRTRTERVRALKSSDGYRAARRASRPSRGTGKRPDLALRNSDWAKSQNLPLSGIRTTQEIYDTLKLGERLNHSVDVAKPLVLPERELLIAPYVLGAWLGDGSSAEGSITGIDEVIFQNIANAGYTISHRPSNPITPGILGLKGQLRALGLIKNKHIPPAYLRASKEQRVALLQGLMDTDGYCDERGRCEFTQVKRPLTDGVSELLASLGIKHEIREGVAKLNGREIGPKYRIQFRTDIPAFRLPRKLLRQKRAGFRGTHDVRYIERADEIDPVPMQCVQVDSPNRMYLCSKQFIPTHNTQLILGLAFNCHHRSLIMRRKYNALGRIIEDMLKINGSRDGYNGSPPPKLRRPENGYIKLGAAERVGDEQNLMGDGFDFLGVDETTHFAEMQIRFVMGWMRSENPKQRKRAVFATNPSLTAEGLWVNKMFAPWLDPQFPSPAKPGELRWAITDVEGKMRWVDGPEEIADGGKFIRPKSFTFIPSSVSDNPFYAATDYQRELDAMPEPYRSILLGGFRTTFKDVPNQIIPTAWIIAAQQRWTERPPEGVPMCSLGVDCSGGGDDPMVIAARYDGWFAPLVEVKGKDIPMERSGAFCAGQIVSYRRDNALVVVDLGGGYGGPTYEALKANQIETKGYKGAAATTRRSYCGKLKFTNTRTAALWLFREALDPGQHGGSPIMLPDDPLLVADLTATTFEPTPNGIKAESKEDVCARIGRSTDHGDAVVMSWYEGQKAISNGVEWAEARATGAGTRNFRPRVIMGGRQPLSASMRR